jgi:hypothetical protein
MDENELERVEKGDLTRWREYLLYPIDFASDKDNPLHKVSV